MCLTFPSYNSHLKWREGDIDDKILTETIMNESFDVESTKIKTIF